MGLGLWKLVSTINARLDTSKCLNTDLGFSNRLKRRDTNICCRWEIRQSDFYAISAWSSSGFMRGNINVYITADWGDKANWGCDRARDLVKDMISAINGWAGAFFGFITPAC